MLQTPELEQAIEGLYSTFSRYELRPNTDPCPCCHGPEDERSLHVKPLAKLSQKDLSKYATDALYTWGMQADFKHFLPRLFELAAESSTFEVDCIDLASLFTKLAYESSDSSSWRSWPVDEQASISGYFHAVWDAALNSNSEDLPIDEIHGWIQAISQAENDLKPYLDRWMAATSVNAHRNLARLIVNEGLPNAPKPGAGYWEGHREQWEQLVDWLRRPEVKQKLLEAVQRWEPLAGELEAAVALLP